MSTWERLSERLESEPGEVTLDWAALEALTGDLPDEARTSPDWWLADPVVRPESAAWTVAGHRVSAIAPGVSITFAPGPMPWAAALTPPPLAADLADPEPAAEPSAPAAETFPDLDESGTREGSISTLAEQPSVPAEPLSPTPAPPPGAPAAPVVVPPTAPQPTRRTTVRVEPLRPRVGTPAVGTAAVGTTAVGTPGATTRRPTSVGTERPAERPPVATRPDIVLIEEGREQGPRPAAAGELFIGPLFAREKAYAGWTGAPWFVLSAEYGLLAPDQVVGPYEPRPLTGSPECRAAWGTWTVARLELLAGPLRRSRIEVHAATPAVSEALRPHLLGLGAYVLEPLRGLSVAERIAWYDGTVPRTPGVSHPAVAGGDPITAALGDAARAARPSDLLAGIDPTLRRPGLYSWFVDDAGAARLSTGLGGHIAPGLIWIGQAGAVRPGSGLSASTNLRNQIAWVHLGRSVRLSPLRRMLAAVLIADPESGVTGEDALTDWIQAHLRVAIVAPEDVEHLAAYADRAAARLAPQLSVEHADPALRGRLRELRAGFDGFAR